MGFSVKANKTQLPVRGLGNFRCVGVVSCAGPDGGARRGSAGMLSALVAAERMDE